MAEQVRVLVVEDDPVSLKILERMLTKAGYLVETASDGQQAWDSLQRSSVQLVISDWIMPRISGLELCQKIRKGGFSRYIYVVLVTSKDAKKDIITALNHGTDDYITKPVEYAELTARLRVGERVIRLEQELQREKEEARLQATHDALTRLHNRRYFMEVVDFELARSKRYGHEISFAMLDIDNFKAVNDTAGHNAGDIVLMLVADMLMHGLRGSDLVVRYGGDEFLIMMVETCRENAESVVARLRKTVKARLAEEQERLAGSCGFSKELDVSWGVAVWSASQDETIEHVLARADAAMYTEKRTKTGKGAGDVSLTRN
jgi:two-component system chemotaxis response regulator CheY